MTPVRRNTPKDHAPWPGDVILAERAATGLKVDCRVRLKLFALDNRLIVRRIGRLAASDLSEVSSSLAAHLMSVATAPPPRGEAGSRP